MHRRKALKVTSAILGATIIGGEFFLSGCIRNPNLSNLFSATDLALLDEVGETILPATERSPGAKAAAIGKFMQRIVTDCYTMDEQQKFMGGIPILNKRAAASYGNDFLGIAAADRFALLVQLDKEAREARANNNLHFFGMMKQLTLWGYFTSEPGATQALRYNPIPGKFIGCIPYKEGDKAWAQ